MDYRDQDEDGVGYPPGYVPPQAIYPNRDESFLQWLFSFRKEAIIPLRNVWRGKEFDFDSKTWSEPEEVDGVKVYKVMNERGITWGISLIESYLSPVYITSDFDLRSYNFTMREASKVIWNNICARYKEFGMKKLDISRVCEEIESKIRAILLGARDNGYRDFLSTQNQNIEHRNLSPEQGQAKRSIWSSLSNVFKKQESRMGDQRGY